MGDATRRFAGRAEAYAAFRPSYPDELVRVLRQECGLTTEAVIADVGSGTGKLAELLLDHGNSIFCIEPEPGMRAAAERALGASPRFTSVAGRAEATTLRAASVDLVVAAQAFHWFDVARARVELARILRPPRPVALIWNVRRTDATPFLWAYEVFLETHGTDYARARHGHADPEALRSFFGAGGFRKTTIEHSDVLDLAGLTGRVQSASYMPAPGHARHDPMLAALAALFRAHQEDGGVRFAFDTEIYTGRLEGLP